MVLTRLTIVKENVGCGQKLVLFQLTRAKRGGPKMRQKTVDWSRTYVLFYHCIVLVEE